MYASLLPFDFTGEPFCRANGFGLADIQLLTPSAEDLWTNILVYIPVGFALVLCWQNGRSMKFDLLARAVIIGMAASLIAEVVQTGIASRVGSWTDVGLNVFGTMIGAGLAAALPGVIGTAIKRIRRCFAERPYGTAASFLTVGLFLYNLVPFDFVTSASALHGSFGRAQWGLFSARPPGLDDPPFALLVGQLGGAAWFAVLGYVLALARREVGRGAIGSIASAVKNGAVLVCTVEFMQLFTLSHTFDLASMALRTIGVGFGAWCAVFVVDALGGAQWRRRSLQAIPTPLFMMACALQLTLLLASAADAHGWSLAAIDPSRIQWLPFEGVWRQPMPRAVCVVLSTVITYGALATTVAVLLVRIGVARPRLTAIIAVAAAALGHEVLQSATISRTADLTGPLLAILASWLAVSILGLLHRSRLDDVRSRIDDWDLTLDGQGVEFSDASSPV